MSQRNLLRDGSIAVAQHAGHVARNATHALVVRDDGGVRLFQRSKFPDDEAPGLVGVYPPGTPVEDIAADCDERLREIAA